MSASAGCQLLGRWRIIEVDTWDRDYLDLVQPAHIVFDKNGRGEFAFGAMLATMELKYAPRIIFFNWIGFDEGDQMSGCGSADLADDGTIEIELSFHNGDDAVLKACRLRPRPTEAHSLCGDGAPFRHRVPSCRAAATALDDFSHYIIAWKPCTTMLSDDITATLEQTQRRDSLDECSLLRGSNAGFGDTSVATRYDRLSHTFHAAVCIAALICYRLSRARLATQNCAVVFT